MKKILLTIAGLVALNAVTSCSDDLLDLKPPYETVIQDAIKTEDDVNKFLMGTYLKMSSASLYGANLFIYGDLLGDSFFRSNSLNGVFTSIATMNYDPTNTGEINFYRDAYDVIQNANFVIYNELEDTPTNRQYKAEARTLRAMAYFNLLSYYASAPKSGQFQEYGVPIAVYPYNADTKLPRASVDEVLNLIIEDLNYAKEHAIDVPAKKYYISKTAAKLFLSKVYLYRQANGDAQLVLDLSREIINSSPSVFGRVSNEAYENYFASSNDALAENQPETVWELDLNSANNPGVNSSMSVYYSRTGSRKGLLARKSFYESFTATDVRKKLFITTSVPSDDNPTGVWIRKHERTATGGNYTRNTKVLRISEAYLNEVEALYLLGKNAEALEKLNQFSAFRLGTVYSGVNLLEDILNERNKEFFGEGQRFLDLKRYNLPIVKTSNCTMNCNVQGGDKQFVFPFSLGQIIVNDAAVQHPLWQ